MSVENGRQVSPNLSGIREDHLNRYLFAASRIKKSSVIDAACGIGYGSKILADELNYVESYDISSEALNYALKHYSHENINYHEANVCEVDFPESDFAVSFETIEHLEHPEIFLANLAKSSENLIASVPNQKILPFDPERHIYHVRHYTVEEFKELLINSGWKPRETYHQIGKTGESAEIQTTKEGNTILIIAEKV